MPYVDRSPLNYRVNTTDPLQIRQETRAPIDDQDGFGDRLLTIWHDVNSDDIYMLVQKSRAQTTTTWVLLGGTPSALSTLTVDAFTAPGTNPVLPDGANTITITGAQVVSGTVGANVIRTDSLAANTFTIEVQQSGEAGAQDTTLNGVCHFNSTQFNVTNGFVELAGGGIAIDQITVDASTPPGTNPVLPDGTGAVTFTGAQVATGTVGANVIRINSAAANTLAVEIQRTTTAAATDSTLNGVSHFDSAAFTVDANGFVQLVGSGTPAVEFLVSSGTSPVVPNASGQITLTDGNGVGVTGSLNAITFDMVSPFTGDFTFTDSAAADPEILTVSHTDNTSATSNAQLLMQTGGASGGDPFITFAISGVQSWSTGIDNSDSDKFKITESADLTSTDRLEWVPGTDGDCFLTFDGQGRLIIGTGTPGTPGAADQPCLDMVYNHVGGQVYAELRNTDNTNSASSAVLNIITGGSSGGDPHIYYAVVGGGVNWTHGIDNSTSDSFKLSQSNIIGTKDTFIMTSAGERTMPLQPAFLATQTLAQNNLPINATTTFTINNEIYDQNGDYDNTTYTFTAPVTGRYKLNFNVRLNTIDTATSFVIFLITTSNRAYSWQIPLALDYSADTNPSWSFSTFADMDALDTALCRIQISNSGASQADVQVDSGSNTWTNFSGALIC